MITTMDKAAAKLLHEEADAALKAVAAKHGVLFAQQRSTYFADSGEFNYKASFKLATIGGVDREQAEFERNAHLFGVSPDKYKTRFTTRDGEFELIGFDPGRPRFPVRARHVSSGKVMLYTTDVLKKINPPAPGAPSA